MLKKLFGGKKKERSPLEYTIEDLIVLEMYEEAATRLQAKLKKSPNDLHSHLKLAEVYMAMRELSKSMDEYVYVAEEYASDGFFDKGIALLSKVQKLFPADEKLSSKIEKIRQSKRNEHMRELALEGLREGMRDAGQQAGNSALELQAMWGKLARTPVVRRLAADQLKQLFSALRFQHVKKNEVLAEEGQELPQLYLIVRGNVEARAADSNGKDTVLRTFSSGDIIGDSAVLKQTPWVANYRVTDPAAVLVLNRQGLEKAMAGNPDPRGFLEALREQRNDEEVAQVLAKLR